MRSDHRNSFLKERKRLKVKLINSSLIYSQIGTVHYVTTGAGALLDVEAVIFEILQGGPSPRSSCHERWENTGNDNGQAICQYYWSTRHMNSGFTSVHVTKERARVSFVTAEVDNPVDDFIVGHEFDILPRK